MNQLFIYSHLFTVLPAFFVGTYLMVRRKGDTAHRALGKVYMLSMFATAILSLFIQAQVGPTLLGHFGFIHLLSLYVLYSVPSAYKAARTGDVITHRNAMIGLYVGGLLVAGGLAMIGEGRLLNDLLFG